MKKMKYTGVALAVLMGLALPSLSQAATTWNSFSSSSPFAPDTTDSLISSASLSGTGITAVSAGGDPGSYLDLFSNPPMTFTLTANTTLKFTTLSLNYQRTAYYGTDTNITWTASVDGGTAVTLPSTTVFGSFNNGNSSWGNLSLSLAAIGIVNAGSTVAISGINTSGIHTYVDNLSVTDVVPEPSTWALVAVGLGSCLLLRRFRTQS